MKKTILMLAAICALGASAAEKDFTYVDASAPVEYIGNNKIETYNVAIRLYQPGFKGYNVTGIAVPVPEGTEMVSPQIWLTTELATEIKDGVKQNVADLATANASIVERDGARWLEGKFAEPVVIPEGGLYAGYTFTIGEKTEANAMPVAGVKTATTDGFFYFTTKSALKWKDYTDEKNFTSAINVMLEGDFPTVAISPVPAGRLFFPASSEQLDLKVALTQFGDEPLESVNYTLSVGGRQLSGEKKFDSPVNIQFGHAQEYDIPFDLQLAAGEYDMAFKVDKVNGKDNGSVAPSYSIGMKMLTYYPVNRPLLEEFTGLWCGYCPRGWAAMKMLEEEHGDMYVCASYHLDPYDSDADPMQIMGSEEIATPIAGYPNMYINRTVEADPFQGPYPFKEAYAFGINDAWKEQQAKFTPWWIDATANWNAEGKIEVNAKVANSFSDASDDFTILYMVVENDLHNPRWVQQNYYTGETEWSKYPYMQQFVDGGDQISDLVFDDVLVYCENVFGIGGAVPHNVKVDQLYEHKYEIAPEDIVNYKGDSLLFNRDKLKVIVALLGNSGMEVLNSIMVPVTDGSGVNAPSMRQGEIVSEKYYDISGNQVDASAKGVLIRCTTDSFGNVKTTKIIRR